MTTPKNTEASELPGIIRRAFDYDAASGQFTWKEPKIGSKAKVGDAAGKLKTDGYIRLYIRGIDISGHRAAWMHFYNEVPPKLVDHINGDRSDNRIENLRLADSAENVWNKRAKASFSGACQHKRSGLWTALIRHRGARHYLGLFKTEEEAKQAYQKAATELRGKFHEQ